MRTGADRMIVGEMLDEQIRTPDAMKEHKTHPKNVAGLMSILDPYVSAHHHRRDRVDGVVAGLAQPRLPAPL
jgi:hypothetical protein